MKWLGLSVLGLAACSPAAPSGTPIADNTQPVLVSVLAADQPVVAGALPTPELDGVRMAVGKWRLDAADTGDAALFVDRKGGLLFGIRCDRRKGRVMFVKSGDASPGYRLKIITASGASTYPAHARDFATGVMAIAPASDSFILTSLAHAQGRIGAMLDGQPALSVPADKMIGAVIGNCDPDHRAQSS